MIWKKQKLCAWLVPHALTAVMETVCCSHKRLSRNDCKWSEFFRFYNHRRQKLVFLIRSRNEKAKCGQAWREFAEDKKIEVSKIKTMLSLFLIVEVLCTENLCPKGHTVNASFYRDILNHLSKHIARVRLDLWKSRSFFLLHDNAPAYNVTIVQQFLNQKRIPTLNHPCTLLIWVHLT